MIIIPQNEMVFNDPPTPSTFVDSPPPYDPQEGTVTADSSKKANPLSSAQSQSKPSQPQPGQPMLAGPSTSYGAVMLPGSPPVHQYRGPNGEILFGLLPPDHPEMICLQRGHDAQTHYGLLGILAAVFWFPLGIGLCMLDRRVKCQRCNQVIDEGLCT